MKDIFLLKLEIRFKLENLFMSAENLNIEIFYEMKLILISMIFYII